MVSEAMTVREAAALSVLDESAIRRAVQRGFIGWRRVGERVLLLNRADVVAYPTRRAGGEKRGRKRMAGELP